MTTPKPSRREHFEIAIICAIPLEYDAVSLIFDEFWDEDGDSYGRADGDFNSYITGRIGKFNVVLALLSHIGKVNAASAAACVRLSYTKIRLALLTGICGGVPWIRLGNNEGDEILLGDVVISKTVVQYDFGRQYDDRFIRKDTLQDNLSEPNKDVGNLLVTFETELGSERLQQRTAYILKELQNKAAQRKRRVRYKYPGIAEDKLFEASYRHKHHLSPICICGECNTLSGPVCDDAIKASCHILGCENKYLVPRERLSEKRQLERNEIDKIQEPAIHIGTIGSGDMVMKSGRERDRIASKEGIIAFEMEGAGVWEEVPCIVVKGPTFVFSLGAWVTPPVFNTVRARLEALGFPSECPAHPSIGAEPPSKTLADDVAPLRSVLTTLADEGKDLVVVASSYGGVVAAAAVEGMTKAARTEGGKPGGVVNVVFMAAFALDKGQSLLGMLRGNYLPWMRVEGDYVHADGAGNVGWQDLPLEEQEKWNATVLHTSRAVFSSDATYEPWHDIPCAYIICEQDRALPPSFQEMFATKVGGPENTYRLPSSHSPFLSMPDRAVDVLLEIMAKA